MSNPHRQGRYLNSEQVWLAGMVSTNGSLSLSMRSGRKRLVYKVKTSRFPEALKRLAAYMHRKPSTCADGSLQLHITGENLDVLLKSLWPELTDQRKHEYIQLRAEEKAHANGLG